MRAMTLTDIYWAGRIDGTPVPDWAVPALGMPDGHSAGVLDGQSATFTGWAPVTYEGLAGLLGAAVKGDVVSPDMLESADVIAFEMNGRSEAHSGGWESCDWEFADSQGSVLVHWHCGTVTGEFGGPPLPRDEHIVANGTVTGSAYAAFFGLSAEDVTFGEPTLTPEQVRVSFLLFRVRGEIDVTGPSFRLTVRGVSAGPDDPQATPDPDAIGVLHHSPTDRIEVVRTERVGQLSGLRDPEGRRVINPTEDWTVVGVDLGANTEHDGRLVFFFGDVATTDNGEHRAVGWNFVIPNDHRGATEFTGQPDWRLCSRCQGLFWAPGGDRSGSVCSKGGEHYFEPDSWNFVLPNDHQGATELTGQPDWRFCGKCHGLFWAPEGTSAGTVCPAGDEHAVPPGSWNFVLPSREQGAADPSGQPGWRFCGKCHGLAFCPDDIGHGTVCPAGNPRNADLVAWTDDVTVTPSAAVGHQPIGLHFVLPNFQQGATPEQGQPDWRFCGKCQGLFWAGQGDVSGSVCPVGGQHLIPDGSWTFVLPNDHQGATGATGQGDWRFCDRCHGLFWEPGYPTSLGDPTPTVCPVDGAPHAFNPASWNFFLPNQEQGAGNGQPDWRFCLYCHGLFWNGGDTVGVCPAVRGGGIRLHPVLKTGSPEFDPLVGDWPVGLTKSDEAPGGAFSHDGRVHVFVNISPERYSEHIRPADPAYGTYLISKDDPSRPGPYQVDLLFSPRIGACPVDEEGSVLQSHQPLGDFYTLPHELAEDPARQSGWRRCAKCAALFQPGAGDACWADGDPHTGEPFDFVLPLAPAGEHEQDGWRRCGRCGSLYWNHDSRGRCRAGGPHQPDGGAELALPRRVNVDNPKRTSGWRFCVNCAGLVWTGGFVVGPHDVCFKTHGKHVTVGLDFALDHDISPSGERQGNWRHCARCAALFWGGGRGEGTAGTCPAGGAHVAGNGPVKPTDDFTFVLSHDVPDEGSSQRDWRFCGKCHGLFWAGHPTGGSCPVDGAGHVAGDGPGAPGFDFALRYIGTGEDAFHNDGGWRFCARCFELVWTGRADRLSGIAPTVVVTSEHSFLADSPTETTLVIAGFGFANNIGVRLAYLPLPEGRPPSVLDTRYFGITADGTPRWSADDNEVTDLFTLDGYSSLSATWIRQIDRWILLYSRAYPDSEETSQHKAFARIARTPMAWAQGGEIPIFDPCHAYGRYMHMTGRDSIDVRVPPAGDDHTGWAYGLHLLNRYTTWDETTGELDIYYLLSLSSPYQVQLMHTTLRLTPG
jgi:hypothetical protein